MSKKLGELPCYTISKETIARTQNCKKGFSCLKGQREDLCLVEYCAHGALHFIKCMNEGTCPYQGAFGDGFICNCPTRKDLYNKYGV